MEKGNAVTGELEKAFLRLSSEEREAVISHGVALRLSHLKKRLFLAENKIRHFEDKYRVTLGELEARGLPEDADYEMHEDYIIWRHWTGVASKARGDVDVLEKIAQQGLHLGETKYAGH